MQQRNRMRSSAFWIGGGVLAGSAVMFLMDPLRGAGRRSRLMDQTFGRSRRLAASAARQMRNAANHARGAVAERAARRRDRRRIIPDDKLVERARAQLGHVVRHPGLLRVQAKDGNVYVSGPVLLGEARKIRDRLLQTRGVRDYELNVTEYPDVSRISGVLGRGGHKHAA